MNERDGVTRFVGYEEVGYYYKTIFKRDSLLVELKVLSREGYYDKELFLQKEHEYYQLYIEGEIIGNLLIYKYFKEEVLSGLGEDIWFYPNSGDIRVTPDLGKKVEPRSLENIITKKADVEDIDMLSYLEYSKAAILKVIDAIITDNNFDVNLYNDKITQKVDLDKKYDVFFNELVLKYFDKERHDFPNNDIFYIIDTEELIFLPKETCSCQIES